MSKHKRKVKIARSTKDMRPGDIYLSSNEGYVFWKVFGGGVHHIDPSGDHWDLVPAANPDMFPAKRAFKQPR